MTTTTTTTTTTSSSSSSSTIGACLISSILKILDSCAWVFTGGPIKQFKHKPVDAVMNSEITGEENGDAIRMRTGCKDFKLVCDWASPDAKTLLDLIDCSVKQYPNMKALGMREFKGKEDVGQKFPVSVFGPTHWTTYKELGDNYHAFGAFLRSIGNKPQLHTKDYDNDLLGEYSLVIFEDTCDMWITAALGAWSQDMFVTTVYGTLGPDAVVQAVEEGERTTLLCNRKNVNTIIDKRNEMPSLKYIIYTDLNVDPKISSQPLHSHDGIEVIPYSKAMEIGMKNEKEYPINKASEDSVAVIMYTSGTTGKPKGVVMPHSSIVFTIGSVIPICVSAVPPHFSHLAYLPLAHIFELAIHIGVLSLGGNIGYADPHTISDIGAKPYGALKEFKPHLIMGVPKVYEVIMKGALAVISKLPTNKQYIVNEAFKWKLSALNNGRYTPLFDKIIFKKIEDMLGGRVTGILSGGGPLAGDVQDWVRTAFGCYVVQGYALTETCAGASFSLLGDTRPFNVGPPIPGCEIMLRSCIDDKGEAEILDPNGLPYLSKDTMDSEGKPCLGRGEVMIRGPSVSYGYFRLPNKTKESFLPNGWFKTGDIGMWCHDGTLRIIDRIKNLAKLKGGEYIAMENMEMVYGGSPYVDALAGGLMVYGDGTMDRPVAIVQVSDKTIIKWADDNNIKYNTLDDVLKNDDVNKEVMKSLMDCYHNGHLLPIEKLSAIGLIANPWTTDNKCLTATNKISRQGIAKRDSVMLESLKPLGRR